MRKRKKLTKHLRLQANMKQLSSELSQLKAEFALMDAQVEQTRRDFELYVAWLRDAPMPRLQDCGVLR